MEEASTYVGLDVHKDSIDVTLAEQGATGEVRHFGTIGGDLEALARLVRRLRRKGRVLHFVYEAGPCGFEIHRFLTEQGLACAVVSPSQIPRRAGDRVKTDRRDSESLARLHRAGELTAVYVPRPRTRRSAISHAPARTSAAPGRRRASSSRRCSCATASATQESAPGRSRIVAGCATSSSTIQRRRSRSRSTSPLSTRPRSASRASSPRSSSRPTRGASRPSSPRSRP